MSEEASREILQFMESLQGEQLDLPDAIMHYWERAIKAAKAKKPNWNEARNCCEHMTMILAKLQGADRDVMQADKAMGLVSILLGAIHLGQNNHREAVDRFERGAKHLQRWGDTNFESLAYFGRVLTHKEEENWPGALEAAQKALDVIRDLPLRHRSKHIKSLQDRIEQEIKLATEASIEERQKPSRPSRPKLMEIPIVSNIAAGVDKIADEMIEDYLLLGDNYSNDADFGVFVKGDSMKSDGILSGDLALIRRKPMIKNGQIAAVVIVTLEGTVEVIKRYHHDEREDLQHWFLESSNPLSEHLVIVPSGVNLEAIQALYAKEIQAGKIRLYKNAELVVAGKYVGLVRKI